jgi:ornithine carbamoyltransferase
MFKLSAKHIQTGTEILPGELGGLLDLAIELKRERKKGLGRDWLTGRSLAMVFDKPSLRTRFSFSVAMSELGGTSVESVSANRKHEEPEDQARVLAGYCDAILVRTHEDSIIEKMASVSPVPVINGLTQLHHPCQILADLMTLKELFAPAQGAHHGLQTMKGLTLSYVGDGNNILHSLLLMAPQLGVNIHFACPIGHQPSSFVLKKARARAKESGAQITSFATPAEAVAGADAVYTDVWTSMGFEAEEKEREKAFAGYQVNEKLMGLAAKRAVVLHCLPMVRGKEISQNLADQPCSAIFRQSENRLHAQKALLVGLLKG